MIDGLSTEYNKTEVLLGIKIDQELCVENKSDVQFNVLVGIAPFMDINKKRNIINAFVASQFDSSHLIWMFHSRGLNNKSYSWKKTLSLISRHHSVNCSIKISLKQYTIKAKESWQYKQIKPHRGLD